MRNPCFVMVLLPVGILIVWTFNKMVNNIQEMRFGNIPEEPFQHVQRSVNNKTKQYVSATHHKSEQQSTRSQREVKLFNYVEPEMAGTGSYNEEFRRYNLFMSSQGVICQHIRHFGGIYFKNKDPPEYDPDGSWYLCLDPEVLLAPSNCVVYSIGINDEWSFDESIARYGCKVYAFDPSMNKQDHYRTPKIQFFNLGLSDVDSEGTLGASGKLAWKTRTLKSIIKALGHKNKLIDVLKMDIEWDEWKCLPQMLADGTLKKYVKQLNVEFHVVDTTPYGVRRYNGIAMWLDRQGFKIANMHRNMYCPQCYETTYINTNLINLSLR